MEEIYFQNKMNKKVGKYSTDINLSFKETNAPTLSDPPSSNPPQASTALGTHAVRPSLTNSSAHLTPAPHKNNPSFNPQDKQQLQHQLPAPLTSQSASKATTSTQKEFLSQPQKSMMRDSATSKQSQSIKQASIELQQGSPLPQQSGGAYHQTSTYSQQHQQQQHQKVSIESVGVGRVGQQRQPSGLKDSLCVDSTEEMFLDQYIKLTGNSVDSTTQQYASVPLPGKLNSTQKQSSQDTTAKSSQKKSNVPVIGFQIKMQQPAKLMSPKAQPSSQQTSFGQHSSKIGDSAHFSKSNLLPSQKFSHSELIPSSDATTYPTNSHQQQTSSASQYGPKQATYRGDPHQQTAPSSSLLSPATLAIHTQKQFQSLSSIGTTPQAHINLPKSKLQISTFLQGTTSKIAQHISSGTKQNNINNKYASTDEYLVKSVGLGGGNVGASGEYHPQTTTNAGGHKMNKISMMTQSAQQLKRANPKLVSAAVVGGQGQQTSGGHARNLKKSAQSQKRSDTAQASSYSSSDGGDIAETNYLLAKQQQTAQSPSSFAAVVPISAPQKFSGGRTSPIKSASLVVVESIQYPPNCNSSSAAALQSGSPTTLRSSTADHLQPSHQSLSLTKQQQVKDRNKNQVVNEYLKKKPQSAKKEPSSFTPAKQPIGQHQHLFNAASITQLPYEQPTKRLSSLHHHAQATITAKSKASKKSKKKTTSIVKSILIPHHSSTASGGHPTAEKASLGANEPIIPLTMTSKQKYSKTFHIQSSVQPSQHGSSQLIGSTKNTSSALQLMQANCSIFQQAKSPTAFQQASQPKHRSAQKEKYAAFQKVVMPSKKSADSQHKHSLTDTHPMVFGNGGNMSERVSKTSSTVNKPKQSLKPPNHILARRISLTQKKQSMVSMPHSMTSSSENLQHHQSYHKQQNPLIEQKRASNGSIQSVVPRRKFANSLVSLPQQVSPLSQVSLGIASFNQTKAAHVPLSVEKSNLKVFARSLLSSASSSTKNLNINQILFQSKAYKDTVFTAGTGQPKKSSSGGKVSVSTSPNSRAIQLVAVKFQQPKLSLIGSSQGDPTATSYTMNKAKSFVQSQLARESPGPGALIASSNRISIIEAKYSSVTPSDQQHPMVKVAPPDALVVPSNLPAPPSQTNLHAGVQVKITGPKTFPFQVPSTKNKTLKTSALFQKPQPPVIAKDAAKYTSTSTLIFTKKTKPSIQLSNTIIGKQHYPQPAQQQQQRLSGFVARSQSDRDKKRQSPPPPLSQPQPDRLDTHTSTATDLQNLSPRTRIIAKLHKKIRINFSKLNQPPETQCDNYKIGKVMGKGAFGKVNLAIHRLSGKFVALKSINKQYMTEEASKRKVMQEFNILRRTRHGNIVKLYESFETPQHIVFVIEVCGGGDLLTYVRRRRKLREDIACHLFRQIIIGLQYCHSKNVLHRDIKLDNILLTSQGTVKICDFGVSKLISKPRELMFEQCGTPAYIAPEVFENKGYLGYQSDVWSAGVVLYAMLYGTVPFKASNMAELHKQVVKNKPDYKEGNDSVSPLALQLLNGILDKDPQKRLTPQQILDHPWMTQLKANKVHVFSQQEKESIMQEFQLYNQKKERLAQDEADAGKHLPTDPFAEQLLVSTQNSGLKNVSSRSVILAPFNSTLSDESVILENRKLINELLLPRRVIKFAAKLNELNRQYELNNNAELDNGVYHQDEADEADGESSGGAARNDITGQSINGNDGGLPSVNNQEMQNLATGFGQQQLQSQLGELLHESEESADDDDDDHLAYNKLVAGQIMMTTAQKRDEQLLHPSSGNLAQSQNSEWKQLQQQMMGSQNQYVANASALGKNHKKKASEVDISYEEVKVELVDELGRVAPQISATYETSIPDRFHKLAIEQIQNCGYPLEFIRESLRSEQLNHVTAFYNLVTSQFEY